jgi:hypothetical protein
VSTEIFRISASGQTKAYKLTGISAEIFAVMLALHCAGDRVSGSATEAAANCAELIPLVSALTPAKIIPIEFDTPPAEVRCFTMLFSRFGLRAAEQTVGSIEPSIDSTCSWSEFLQEHGKNPTIRNVLSQWERDFLQKPFANNRVLATA